VGPAQAPAARPDVDVTFETDDPLTAQKFDVFDDADVSIVIEIT